MSKEKVGTYRLRFPLGVSEELKYTIVELNRVFALLEDRLDKMEATRGEGYFVTAQKERKFTGG